MLLYLYPGLKQGLGLGRILCLKIPGLSVGFETSIGHSILGDVGLYLGLRIFSSLEKSPSYRIENMIK
jgi:hypothetical protein